MGQSTTALIVTKDPALARQVRRLVRTWGISLASARGLDEARGIMANARNSPQIILVDAETLDCNPVAFAAQLPHRSRPLIIVQPGRERCTKEQLLAAGYRAVLRSWNTPEIYSAIFEPLTEDTAANATRLSSPVVGRRRFEPAILLTGGLEVAMRVAETTLQRAGYRVVTRTDSEEALHALQTEQFSAFVIGSGLRNRSALELVQLYRSMCSSGLKAVPVLMLTADTQRAHHQACLDAGADRCLTVPYHPWELLHAVAALAPVPWRDRGSG